MGGPRISVAGESAVLLDAAGGRFEAEVQFRVWAAAALAREQGWVREAAPGMNNLLVTYDPFETEVTWALRALREVWFAAEPRDIVGREVVMPVVYGGVDGEDLAGLAAHSGFSIDEVVRRHSAATYRVAAIGAMPGYPYMFGLDPALAWNRRATPRLLLRTGAVTIGAGQASVMPVDAPSGWHMLGRTEVRLFDPLGVPPALLQAGDAVRFSVLDIVA